jgi:predicted phosphoribosyltransferase
VDEFVAVITPKEFSGVGECYEDFSPTSDDEVRELLEDPASAQQLARS